LYHAHQRFDQVKESNITGLTLKRLDNMQKMVMRLLHFSIVTGHFQTICNRVFSHAITITLFDRACSHLLTS
jgi:hypothetical protein